MPELEQLFPKVKLPGLEYDSKIAHLLYSEDTQQKLEKDLKKWQRLAVFSKETGIDVTGNLRRFHERIRKLDEKLAKFKEKITTADVALTKLSSSSTYKRLTDYKKSLKSDMESEKRNNSSHCTFSTILLHNTCVQLENEAQNTNLSKSFFLRVGERVYEHNQHKDPKRHNSLEKVINRLQNRSEKIPTSFDHSRVLTWAKEGFMEYILAYFVTVKHLCNSRKLQLMSSPEKDSFAGKKLLTMIADDLAEMNAIEILLQNVPKEGF